jgi:hypothetical protein
VLFQILLSTNKKISIILRIPKLRLFLYSFTGCWVTSILVNFSLQISFKTYPGPMQPPGGQSRQLIYPTYLLFQSTLPNVCREVGLYSALFTYVIRWHTGAVTLSPGKVILAQLACYLSDVMFCLHQE